MMMSGIKIEAVRHHRNGVSGGSFYVVGFRWDKRDMVAILPSDGPEEEAFGLQQGQCFVLDVNRLAAGDFGGTTDWIGDNTWRGDHFEPNMRKAVLDYEKAQAG